MLIDRQTRTDEKYSAQPVRLECVVCRESLAGVPSQYSRGDITYLFCRGCGTINGNHELTRDFIEFSYTGGLTDCSSAPGPYEREYDTGVRLDEYQEVVRQIYVPKALFLRDYLESKGQNPETVSVLDIGCGSGHLLAALKDVGFQNLRGIETLPKALEVAVEMLGSDVQLDFAKPDALDSELERCHADVVAMMCVLPHLAKPLGALKAMQRNSNIKLTYQKFPLWSFATLLESVFPESHSRVLSSDHTYVFTNETLLWIEQHLGVRRVASWRFGSDALDLARRLCERVDSSVSNGTVSTAYAEYFRNAVSQLVEGLQDAIDKRDMSSEVHLIWEFER